MRFIVMFVTAVCVLFLIKLRWPKKKNFYDTVYLHKLILVPRGRDPFGQLRGSRPLARPLAPSNDIPVLNGFGNTID